MDCYTKFFKVDGILTLEDRKIFENLQKRKHESAGSLIFNKYGDLIKFNTFLGGYDIKTWGHGHIVNYHTHPNKYKAIQHPPSYIDFKTELWNSYRYYKKFKIQTIGLVFDKKGCWIYRPNKVLLKELLRTKNKKKLLSVVKNNSRILNIQFAQPQHIIKINKTKFPKISTKQYVKSLNSLLTPGFNTGLGFTIKFIPKNRKLIIPEIHQCIEKIKSSTRVYNIPPVVELSLFRKKYV